MVSISKIIIGLHKTIVKSIVMFHSLEGLMKMKKACGHLVTRIEWVDIGVPFSFLLGFPSTFNSLYSLNYSIRFQWYQFVHFPNSLLNDLKIYNATPLTVYCLYNIYLYVYRVPPHFLYDYHLKNVLLALE